MRTYYVVEVPESESLHVTDLDGKRLRTLFEAPVEAVELDIEAFQDARRDGLTHGPLVAAALGLPRGTSVTGKCDTLDVICAALLRMARASCST